MTKMKAMVFMPEQGNQIRFRKIKWIKTYSGKIQTGDLEYTGQGHVLAYAHNKADRMAFLKNVWTWERPWPFRRRQYVPVRTGDPRPLVIKGDGIEPARYPDDEFYLAVESRQSTEFNRGGMDIKVIMILGLLFINFMLGVFIYQLAR